ncbi:MAG: bi-domain-containing oxidoreductase [Acidobacteria bacterium]|nr:bi-domain-containing oxidoreductase [Acidobacteriota bacterium]
MKQVLIRRGSPTVVDVPAPQLTDNTLLVEVCFSLISTGTEVAGLVSSSKSLVRRVLEDPTKVLRALQMLKEGGYSRTRAVIDGEMESASPTGYSCSGVVLACGKNIRNFSVGDRVACAGAGIANHAEIVVVPQNLAVRVPDGCDLESAASATIGSIALQGVRRSDMRLGETAVVIGLGLIGQLTVQLLKAAGCRIIGSDIEPRRVSKAQTLGLTAGLHPDDSDLIRSVMDLTEGRGADAVIVTASSQSTAIVQQAMQMVRPKGRVVVVGAVPLQVDRTPFYEKEADLLISCSYGPGRYDPEYEERGLDYPFAYVRWTENRNMAEYLRLVAGRQINVRDLIETIRPASEAASAYSDLSENKHIAALLSNPEGDLDRKIASRVTLPVAPAKAPGLIRVGIIGPGSFASAVHLPNLKRLNDSFTIGAVVARTGPHAWNVARQYGAQYASTSPEDLFKDSSIDLIVIASRHDLHAPLAIEAARHGKAVLLEKPAALTEDELEDLLEAFKSSGTLLMVGFNRRFSPFIREAKTVLDGRTGPLVVTYRMNAGYIPPSSWVYGPEGGGRIIGEACHIFDLFNYLVGHFPEKIVALPLRSKSADVLSCDNFTSTLRYDDGSLCTLTYTSLGSAEIPKETMEVFVDGKTLALEDYRRLTFHGTSRKPNTTAQQEKGHLEELKALAEFLRGRGSVPMTLEEIEAATRSSFSVDRLVRTESCVES